ncbi:MAG: hypothetical protein ABFS42_14870 [Candidatus Krumholzibacteriota bacterium]
MIFKTSFLTLLCLLAVAGTAAAQVISDRIEVLTDDHGFFPCMDCHGDQESVPTPRILEEEHAEPMEWEDADGGVHLVSFGDRVAIADLLGTSGRTDLIGKTLVRIGANVQIETYMEFNGLTPEDSVWTMVHGGGNLWCLDCHDDEDRDKLVRLNGDLLTFNESHLLCGECHGPALRDWDRGIHGSTTGYWDMSRDDGETTMRMLCVECHLPHNPSFKPMTPLAGPVVRIPGRKVEHGDEEGSH